MHLLCRGEDGAANGLWQTNGQKELLRVEVVITGLIDNSDHTTRLGLFIFDGDIDLAAFEGNVVPLVLYADYQLPFVR